MRPFWALIAQAASSNRGGRSSFSAAALFGLGWLFVYVTSLNEAEIRANARVGRKAAGGFSGCRIWESRSIRRRSRS